jgi:hypothetical protein
MQHLILNKKDKWFRTLRTSESSEYIKWKFESDGLKYITNTKVISGLDRVRLSSFIYFGNQDYYHVNEKSIECFSKIFNKNYEDLWNDCYLKSSLG